MVICCAFCGRSPDTEDYHLLLDLFTTPRPPPSNLYLAAAPRRLGGLNGVYRRMCAFCVLEVGTGVERRLCPGMLSAEQIYSVELAAPPSGEKVGITGGLSERSRKIKHRYQKTYKTDRKHLLYFAIVALRSFCRSNKSLAVLCDAF